MTEIHNLRTTGGGHETTHALNLKVLLFKEPDVVSVFAAHAAVPPSATMPSGTGSSVGHLCYSGTHLELIM